MLGLIAVLMACAVLAAYYTVHKLRRAPSRSSRRPPRPAAAATYVPFAAAEAAGAVVVDCTSPTQPTFTHHKGHNNPPDLPPADTSTGLVLNALRAGRAAPGCAALLERGAVAVNHFDGDALFSAWAFINPAAALAHEALLRSAAALHYFREADLSASEGSTEVAALALCCWINTVERTKFSPPYDDKDADEKFAFFLRELGPFLEAPGLYREDWEEEYERVLAQYGAVAAASPPAVRRYADVGVGVVEAAAPTHYYTLFSHTLGCDAVVSSYPGRRYELEQKYTQFVSVHSRPVQARLDLGPLAAALNRLDTGRDAGTAWGAPRLVDTGPLLRLDVDGQKLPKRERYGHPSARPVHASGLTPAQFEAAVVGYFRHGLQGHPPRVGGWSWEALHRLNAGVEWAPWEAGLCAALSAGGA
jgi:hypothetical protein